MQDVIYMDNAATTRTSKEVVESMIPYFTQNYGNASALYSFAQDAKIGLENARKQVAKVIGAKSEEIYFTAGGSEADNWAIKATAEFLKAKGNHIITSKIEHHAVLHSCQYLEQHGYEVTYLDVDEYGMINLEELKAAIRPTTILITIMFANNEIGTIEPIKEIGAIAKENHIYFHTAVPASIPFLPQMF